MPEAIIPIATSVIGGLASKSKSNTQTASKEPWSAVQPWLKDLIASGQTMQQQYAANPFNDIQKAGYENLLGNLNNFQQNTAPGLLDFANGMMSNKYQRQQYSAPGTAGYAARGGLLSSEPGRYDSTNMDTFQPTNPPSTTPMNQRPIFNNQSAKPYSIDWGATKAPVQQASQPLDLTNQEVFKQAMQAYNKQQMNDLMYDPSYNWNASFIGGK